MISTCGWGISRASQLRACHRPRRRLLQLVYESATRADLEQQLIEHIDWLRASAGQYDARYFSETKRMATSISALVHDTGASTSLLSQLGMGDQMVWSSAVAGRDCRVECPPWSDVPHESGFAD
jgi:hypothetical protein